MLKKILHKVKKAIVDVVPAFLFFLISLSILDVTEKLFLRKTEIWTPVNFYTILLAAAVVAKILIVLNHLPFMNFFPKKPLIYNIAWKTFFYSFCVALTRLIIFFIPFYKSTHSYSRAMALFSTRFDFTRFFALAIWYVLLFFIFVTAEAFTSAIGKKKVIELLFGGSDSK